MTRFFSALAMAAVLLLTGCDKLMEIANQGKANGKAVGAGCRHAGRSLEDCYRRNPRIAKAEVFAGWKEMNEYMQAKKIDVVPPPADEPKAPPAASEANGEAADNPQGAAAENKPAATSSGSSPATVDKAPAGKTEKTEKPAAHATGH